MNLDKFNLLNEEINLLKRYDKFIEKIREFGFNPRAISDGNLDSHMISYAFKIAPQIVRMYFGLYLCDEEERKKLNELKLDIGIVRTLMLIEPEIRNELYKNLNEILQQEFPLKSIISYIDNGNWRIRILNLFDLIDKNYWAAVSAYLKDINLISGTLNAKFRSMLMGFKIYKKASYKQLNWLEREIIYDHELDLQVFMNPSLKKDFPEAVKIIKLFLEEYELYDS